ncbi:MAG: FRG domain-containing protein [Polyangiaceae bacterium]|nr:FRG domain-containing protein [Polyangiaceae bacterium]
MDTDIPTREGVFFHGDFTDAEKRRAVTDIPTREGVEEHHVATANDLLDVLSPRNTLWEDNASSWIFRGHANANWELKPSAVRNYPKCFKEVGITKASEGHKVSDGEERTKLEECMCKCFMGHLDRSGIAVPSELPHDGRPRFNPDPTLPVLALAQHHGLPTSLLDWTRRAWIAAYFASAEAVRVLGGLPPSVRQSVPKSASYLAVWALERGNPSLPSELDHLFYDAPAWTNPNLRAQAGLFTRLDITNDLALEELLPYLRQEPHKYGHIPRLRRFTLSIAEAGRLLRFLSQDGIDGASMFPGADGVVRKMRESALWDRPPRFGW